MNLKIINFTKNDKILKKYICTNQGGDNISPKISWKHIPRAESYALILEDPDAVINGTFIHWYIPYINTNILGINELKHIELKQIKSYDILNKKNKKLDLVQGKNSLDTFGYHGPCAPNNTDHHYTFYIYALNDKITINEDNLVIKDHLYFEKILKKKDITIIANDFKTFTYHHLNYSNET
jgi:Raf kinase inhibitor-like YbhB/YbcL family protein